jgi:hypothetical protein
MTDHAAHASHAKEAGSAGLPAIFSAILAIIWGAYTALICFEIFSTPLPQL